MDHGSFFSYQNQTYFASGGMDNPNQYIRASYLAPCHYQQNGVIVIEQKMMEYGVGQYDAVWERIEAEWYFAASKDCKIELGEAEFAVGGMNHGDFLFYPNISNVEENCLLKFGVAAGNGDAYIEIRDGSLEGEVLGNCHVEGKVNWDTYQTVYCPLKNTAGVKNIYLVVKGENEGELLRIDWLTFDSDTTRSTMEPAL